MTERGRSIDERDGPAMAATSIVVLGALLSLWLIGAREGVGGGSTAGSALAQGTPSPAVDVEAAVLDAAQFSLGTPISTASVEIDVPERGVVRYRVAAMVMAGAVDSLEIRRYPSAEAAAEAVALLGGGVGGPFPFSRDSGGHSSYMSGHFQAVRWFAWAQGTRVFKAERQYVSTYCGDAPSPSRYAEVLALAAVDHDLIPPIPMPRPTPTCSTPLTAEVEFCAVHSPTVRVSGTTGEGECVVSVVGGGERVSATVTDGSFALDVPLPEIGRVYRLMVSADCGDGCSSLRSGPGLTTWRLPAATPDATITGTVTMTPTSTPTSSPTSDVPITGTIGVTPTWTPTPTGSPTPSPSPTSFRELDLAVSAELASLSATHKRLTAAVENLGPAVAVGWDLELRVGPSDIVFFIAEPVISGAFVTHCSMAEERSRYSCRLGPLGAPGVAEIVADIGHASHGPPSSQVCVHATFPPLGVTGRDTNPLNDRRCVTLGLTDGLPPTPPTPAARLALPWLERPGR